MYFSSADGRQVHIDIQPRSGPPRIYSASLLIGGAAVGFKHPSMEVQRDVRMVNKGPYITNYIPSSCKLYKRPPSLTTMVTK